MYCHSLYDSTRCHGSFLAVNSKKIRSTKQNNNYDEAIKEDK